MMVELPRKPEPDFRRERQRAVHSRMLMGGRQRLKGDSRSRQLELVSGSGVPQAWGERRVASSPAIVTSGPGRSEKRGVVAGWLPVNVAKVPRLLCFLTN